MAGLPEASRLDVAEVHATGLREPPGKQPPAPAIPWADADRATMRRIARARLPCSGGAARVAGAAASVPATRAGQARGRHHRHQQDTTPFATRPGPPVTSRRPTAGIVDPRDGLVMPAHTRWQPPRQTMEDGRPTASRIARLPRADALAAPPYRWNEPCSTREPERVAAALRDATAPPAAATRAKRHFSTIVVKTDVVCH
ncbi:hypothetical protein [Burkholderia plantarii]|uniref:hypothetical protein n=1 Tax=Burkholderia plantarii TaxID=41899 RepID=UPI0018DDFEDE|nr:hypothetical protein [Burkholderia plantarii]MBI0331794.1 hypothetical protein [Burkholderia plantarii]